MGRTGRGQRVQVVAAFQTAHHAVLGVFAGDFHQRARDPGIVVLVQAEPRERVVFVRVETGGDDDELRLEAIEGGQDFARISRAEFGTARPAGRVDAATIAASTIPASENPSVYVCGPTGFVEAVADLLVTAGHSPDRIRTERFGGA